MRILKYSKLDGHVCLQACRVDRAQPSAAPEDRRRRFVLEVTETTEGLPETPMDAEQELKRIDEMVKQKREAFPDRFMVTESPEGAADMKTENGRVAATDEWLAAHEGDLRRLREERRRAKQEWLRAHPLEFSESTLGDLETPQVAEV